MPDHPRSRGVYGAGLRGDRSGLGSSPLARGLRTTVRCGLKPSGIIPARAGFTARSSAPRERHRDHPRSRGVYLIGAGKNIINGGSSPLARGLRGVVCAWVTRAGIIPARAGFTQGTQRPRSRRRDHPRSRGVYDTEVVSVIFVAGSSPLARGLRPPHNHITTAPRIIPARAGFTLLERNGVPVSRDHPRSRGVYSLGDWWGLPVPGSSPLARGLLIRLQNHVMEPRIIPARAGFTLADPWNPNDEPPYQTAFAFTADLVLAPQSSGSAVVSQRSTRTPSEA